MTAIRGVYHTLLFHTDVPQVAPHDVLMTGTAHAQSVRHSRDCCAVCCLPHPGTSWLFSMKPDACCSLPWIQNEIDCNPGASPEGCYSRNSGGCLQRQPPAPAACCRRAGSTSCLLLQLLLLLLLPLRNTGCITGLQLPTYTRCCLPHGPGTMSWRPQQPGHHRAPDATACRWCTVGSHLLLQPRRHSLPDAAAAAPMAC